jgi:hypothetical protein
MHTEVEGDKQIRPLSPSYQERKPGNISKTIDFARSPLFAEWDSDNVIIITRVIHWNWG